MASVVILYIYDSGLLLHSNEGILIPKSKDQWLICFGSDMAGGMRKELFLPNPFLPSRPLFRLSWQFEGSQKEEEETWISSSNTLMPMASLTWVMVFSLFFFLPVGLFTKFGDKSLLLAGLLLYFSMISSLIYLWFHRASLSLSRRRLMVLAFESIVCPPFALNLIRKVSTGIYIKEDLVTVARRLQKPDEWAITRLDFIKRLDEKIELEDEDSPRLTALKDHRRKLAGEDI